MRNKLSSKERLRRFLRPRVGEVITGSQLQTSVGPQVTEWARRLRELRNDEGWPILSHNDDATLKPGEYKLTGNPPEGYRFSKSISSRIRAEVLERNGYTCQMCGAGAGESDPENPNRTVRLHVGHILDRSHGGSDAQSNLRALCSACNQGAKNLTTQPPPWTHLLAQLRKANVTDQRKALEWLIRKFRPST